ncbi:MAG TPA: GtrA family protein [Accumulibacter sp.]|nr:GtrA family protein [Accumulibacter sp.]HMW17414.1 GtrA family protein [Accumulibacter sp.]HMX22016.1 GtrA family protein [Accumulibacter sp.]HMY06607.1 GtrA family protein [Accumulibacter sp.]HNC17815.1 GtrA family protein [Accumulibacter sp.]
MRKTLRQITLFILVGCAAALTHWLTAIGCVAVWRISPLWANVIGWLVAFVVSFAGHYRLTFRESTTPLALACRRFFIVSSIGFAINELSYAYLLHATAIAYDTLLAIILLTIAALTFVLSRWWAFRNRAAVS